MSLCNYRDKMSLMEGLINLSDKQLRRHAIITQLIDKLITRQQAATTLGLSLRQIDRLKKGYLQEGPSVLVHKNTGRKPAHAIKEEVINEVIRIKALDGFRDANINHFRELLMEYHNISICYSSLYTILHNAGYSSPLKKKRPSKHRRRQRKPYFGQLLQIDATPFEWFSDGKRYALHAAIDDATGTVTGAYFTHNECLLGYLEIMRQTALSYGIPQTVYSDKHTIFRSPKTDRLSLEEELAGKKVNLTQFGRSLHDLGINLIHAHSPQAKGRIERLWVTLQSRLPVEFTLRNITTIEQANEFMSEYLKMFNNGFSVNNDAPDIFVPFEGNYDIDAYLCTRHIRTVDNGATFSINRRIFKVVDDGYPIIPKSSKVDVLISTRKGIRVRFKERIYNTVDFIGSRLSPSTKKQWTTPARKRLEPHLKHGTDEWKDIWHAESIDDTMHFLYSQFLDKDA